MNLEEVAALTAELLGEASARLVAADYDTATHDHAAAEAFVLVESANYLAADDPGLAALLLTHGLALLSRLPVPTGLEWVDGVGWVGIFRRRLWVELESLGLPPPTLQTVQEVLFAA